VLFKQKEDTSADKQEVQRITRINE